MFLLITNARIASVRLQHTDYAYVCVERFLGSLAGDTRDALPFKRLRQEVIDESVRIAARSWTQRQIRNIPSIWTQ